MKLRKRHLQGFVSDIAMVKQMKGKQGSQPFLLLREFGARAVHTFDVNQHYSSARIVTTAREIMEIVDQFRRDDILSGLTGYLPDEIDYSPRTRIQDIADRPLDEALDT